MERIASQGAGARKEVQTDEHSEQRWLMRKQASDRKI